MEKEKTVLVVNSNTELKDIAIDVFANQKYRVITAISGNEARLKYSNEKFDLLVLDMETSGFSASDFVNSVRRKESFKNLKDHTPILITGSRSDEFSKQFSMMDNIKYLETPFSVTDLKKKLFTFSDHSSVISNNTRVINAGEMLITEGGTNHEMFWVLSGKFTITKMNVQGNNVILGEVFPGELVGEMSFLDNLPRSASVIAAEDCEVLAIPHKKFIDVLDNQPRWFRSLMQTLSQRLRKTNVKITEKSTLDSSL